MNFIKMTIEEFRAFVGGGIFTAKFLKKDDSERVINARLGVSKGVKGTAPEATEKRNATLKSNNMVGVFEMTTGEYRTLNLDRLIELHANGQTIKA